MSDPFIHITKWSIEWAISLFCYASKGTTCLFICSMTLQAASLNQGEPSHNNKWIIPTFLLPRTRIDVSRYLLTILPVTCLSFISYCSVLLTINQLIMYIFIAIIESNDKVLNTLFLHCNAFHFCGLSLHWRASFAAVDVRI